MTTLPEARPASGLRRREMVALAHRLRYPLGIYLASRVLYMLVALADGIFQHTNVGIDLANWDGYWYVLMFHQGYPQFSTGHLAQQTTLGFLPLYTMVVWLVAQVLFSGPILAGVLTSIVFGAVATVLIDELAHEWWEDQQAARRAVVMFCFFPGSVVFSMVYTEALLITLVAGCLIALSRRRWLLAGVLAGLSTAVGPVAEAIIPTCILAAALEFHRNQWSWRDSWRSLFAPILSPFGLILFGIFLWIWTGTPFASYDAQRYGWSEKSTPLAIFDMVRTLVRQIGHGISHIDLNMVAGTVGTILLLYSMWRLWKWRRHIGWPPLMWTLGVAVLTLTSAKTPPNARMLICAFPVLMIFAAEMRSRRWWAFTLLVTVALTIVMTYLTLVGDSLRP